jgi:hypothetical protein
MSNTTPTIANLQRALAVAEQIAKLQAELASIVGDSSSVSSTRKPTASPVAKKGKRTMSPEARAKIAAAQKARWAKAKGGKAPAAAVKAKKKPAAKAKGKRTLSPEGRAKIVAALKARWAAKKKAAK